MIYKNCDVGGFLLLKDWSIFKLFGSYIIYEDEIYCISYFNIFSEVKGLFNLSNNKSFIYYLSGLYYWVTLLIYITLDTFVLYFYNRLLLDDSGLNII